MLRALVVDVVQRRVPNLCCDNVSFQKCWLLSVHAVQLKRTRRVGRVCGVRFSNKMTNTFPQMQIGEQAQTSLGIMEKNSLVSPQ